MRGLEGLALIAGMAEALSSNEGHKSATVEELQEAAKYFDNRIFAKGDVLMLRKGHDQFCKYTVPVVGEAAIVLGNVEPTTHDSNKMVYENETMLILAKCSSCPMTHRIAVDPVHFEFYKAPEPKEEPEPEPQPEAPEDSTA